MSKVYDEAIRILDNNRITIADETVYRPGSLFQVKIPDEDVMLDEQKPFEEQPGKVRKALEKYGHRKATHKQFDAYRGKTGRYDLSNSDAIEEMLADEFIKPASRHEILGKLAKQDKGAVERLVAWMKRVIDRIASVFQNPQGKLTTAQRDAFVTSFGKMAGSLKDQNGKPIFKTYDGYKTIKLANGKELAAEEKTSSNRKYSLDNSDNRRYSVSRITGTQKDELFRQVSSHLSSYIDEQVAKGKNLADLLEELASEHSSHREKLLGGYRATARDFEVRKDDKEHRQTVVEAHWPEAKTWTENREAKIKEAYDLFTSQIKEVVDYAGVLYREIVIDRERASRNPEGGIQLHSWRDAERQRAEREAGNHQNSIRPTSRSDESGFSIARSMDELKAEVKEAFPGAKVQESGNKLIFTMPNGQKITFTFHESIRVC